VRGEYVSITLAKLVFKKARQFRLVVECLLSKHKALSSGLIIAKK
jgi:hypothetical protein